jgi:hypothetical protein
MDRVLDELTRRGLLGPREVQWARECSDERKIPIDSALLVLDLVDEEGLLRALAACTGIVAASGATLREIDVEAAKGLPQSFARSFSLCPLRRSANRVVALVNWPLPSESVQELKEVFRLEVEQMVVPSHVMAMALERIYGVPAGPFFHELEERIERRRGIEDVASVLGRLRGAASLSDALAIVLTFATARAEFACFFARQGDALRPLTVSASGTVKGAPLALPDRASTIWPALSQGGYFLGPPSRSEADDRFYRGLQRPLPRWVCVIPAPVGLRSSLLFYSDNGARGLATRWVAEWVLLVSRIGQTGGIRSDVGVPVTSPATGGADGERDTSRVASGAESPGTTVTVEERRVLDKLAGAAASAGQPLDVFVDRLLAAQPHEAVDEATRTALLVGEVKGFFDKLASEIPAHFARGMEAAFRELAPRMVAMGPPAGAPAPSAARASAELLLVAQPAAPREIATYQSKRRKTERVKM